MKNNPAVSWQRVDPSTLDLKGRNVAVIGGTGGIGRAISRSLASRGARVIVVGRTFRDQGVPGLEFVSADLSLLKEARRVGKELPAESLDLVVLTAGIMAGMKRQETAEGIEQDMAVSYLSRLVLVREIAPRLGKDRPGDGLRPRVFVMGFPGYGFAGTADDLNAEKSYSSMTVHGNTVAGNEMLVLDSARRYPGVSFFGLNPGMIESNIRGNMLGEGSFKHRAVEWLIGALSPSAEKYAERLAPLFFAPDLDRHSGAMFNNKAAAVLPTPRLVEPHVSQFIAASEVLASRALS